jgi:hypothetical protein
MILINMLMSKKINIFLNKNKLLKITLGGKYNTQQPDPNQSIGFIFSCDNLI